MKRASITPPQRDRANPFDNAVHSRCVQAAIHNADSQQQVARMYDVFGRLILSSKCYLAAFIAITAFPMWPNIVLMSLTDTYIL
jgi:hypothetical protein